MTAATAPRFLLNQIAIGHAVASLMALPGERIIACGFVGATPLAMLPADLTGVDVLCWDKPGATQPQGVAALIGAGAQVWFLTGLHAKIYWHAQAGVIMGSSNLSNPGLCDSSQIEACVELVDVDGVIEGQLNEWRGRAVACGTDAFNLRFQKLIDRDIELRQRLVGLPWLKMPGMTSQPKSTKRTFAQWLALDPGFRQPWQLGYWVPHTGRADRYAAAKWKDRYADGNYSNYRRSDTQDLTERVATLDLRIISNGKRSKAAGSRPHWWFPEKRINSREKGSDPYHWFARVNVPLGSPLPFAIDAPFLKAVECALVEFGLDRHGLAGPVGEPFLNLLAAHYAPRSSRA
jgi:hypothetical protein